MTISPEIDATATVRICASLDSLAARMDREHAWRQKIAGSLFQAEFAGAITITAGAGTYDQPDQLQAKAGFIWCIRRLTVQGFSAGSVTAYRNSTTGEPVLPFPVPAVNTLSKGQLILKPGDRIVWGASGITGTVTFWGSADCFESWYLPYYIG